VSSLGSFGSPPGTHAFAADALLVSVDGVDLGLDVVVGSFVDDAGERYWAVQNARHPGADFPSASSAAGTVHLAFAPGVTRLIALGATLVPIDVVDGAVDVELDAGDVMLFKVDTGAPFARRAGSY
jgi:hypothetical protein